MTLHILNRSAFSSATPDDALRAAVPGDALVLVEDGVYCALDARWCASLPLDVAVYVLSEDLEARGLGARTDARVQTVTVDDFVELTATHSQSISWF
ncbi:sulfurtransferase complex subunit TusB [Larsenimonas salina]|uniref:sulfurtransferase complex subunit TusB n=1 Tax=Larsenimonas salina TaxID=1295565 RepID=UPI002072AD45|nr:sulfurtransferase complex subunit TusB [Larsenimonas salina]MCM5703508.1 sulfurtransferase complex subunit TusB [Larsenimonas salina]